MKELIVATAVITTFMCGLAYGEEKSPDSAFTISGYVEAYYSHDFNMTINNTKPSFVYSYNKNNEASVNLAFVKGSYNTDNVRVNLALAGGSYMSSNYASEPGVLNNIYESNVGLKLSDKNNVWIDVGVFASHLGFESAVGKDNWTLTRSFSADNTPYYETGAKISYTSENDV